MIRLKSHWVYLIVKTSGKVIVEKLREKSSFLPNAKAVEQTRVFPKVDW